jgi:glycerol-3-phosphate dehydrogenase
VRRDTLALASQRFDLVVVGGGIAGAFVAWDAALRGLRVALLEKEDFGHGTSASSGRIIHSGLRYLQSGAVGQLRESFRESRIFRRIAPHLVRPLPFVIPTGGRLLQGRVAITAALRMHALLTSDLGRGAEPSVRELRHRVLLRDELLELAPGLDSRTVKGGVLFEELQMEYAERLTLAVVSAAAAAGACVANYVEVTGALKEGDRVVGVQARDRLTEEPFEVSSRVVANMTGPWAGLVAAALGGKRGAPRMRFAKGVHIVTGSLTRDVAVALRSGEGARAWARRGSRHIFIMPWRGRSLIGATNTPFSDVPDRVSRT